MSADQQPNGMNDQFNVQPGDVIFQAPAAVVDPDGYLDTADIDPVHLEAFVDAFGTSPGVLAVPGLPGADALLVLEVQENLEAGDSPEASGATIVAVRLGLMSSEAVANHLPALADKLTKPKVFFIGGDNEPVVLAVGLLDTDRLELDATNLPTPSSPEAPAPTRFGARGQFMLISTAEEAPSVDEQVAQVVGHVDPSMLCGLRLFHSYVLLRATDVRGWLDSGIADLQAATAEDVFTDRPAETWRQIMKNSPFPKNLFATWASHPERN
ncbi:hypothetical protein COJE103337_06805 [Corynebacterium jeikeium]|uniref:hypothetical protein n=2 Tax=Corynebacteriaceae TaxID=1653 RepID=UPI0001B71572|nr:hypothetical protein [Corynebacterium jeikeium]EEW15620.1 hypothetical protein HMPREF0297_1993 [Corynebacterium jeikeium ATCC 43734]MCG7456664.1 hypothetical protein [Corynebacterium sp. ACRPH]WCZ54740.1 hypothetical protein CJEIK_11295 [Corynebacterium jeikeium]SUY82158.1 Uncharacterised protein [Corynebacterium jeikeium]